MAGGRCLHLQRNVRRHEGVVISQHAVGFFAALGVKLDLFRHHVCRDVTKDISRTSAHRLHTDRHEGIHHTIAKKAHVARAEIELHAVVVLIGEVVAVHVYRPTPGCPLPNRI